MPSTVNSSRAQSEELGNEDAPAYSANGRPLRKSAGKRQSDPEFVNSTEVIQDAMGDMKEDNKMLLTSGRRTKTVKRKRARSPSPSAPPLSPVQCITDADFTTPQETTPAPVEVTETTESEVPGINLTINIPAGFVGPIKLQLDQSLLSKFTQSQAKSPKNVAPAKPAERLSSLNPTLFKRAKAAEDAQKTKTSKSKKLTKWIKKYGSPPRGFLDLPAELRNTIYRMVFVTKEPIDFGDPKCDRSAAFLRTCKMVHQEGSSVLYSENQFKFVRNKNSRNPFWTSKVNEIGYIDMRHFLAMIGPLNLTYLRKIHIVFDDASKSHAHLYEDPRFVHDANLLASLKVIAKSCFLKKICLTFLGRRNVSTFDVRFLEHLCAIQVDSMEFNPGNHYWHGDKYEVKVHDLLKSEMTRLEPLFERDEKPRPKKRGRNW